MKTANPTTKRTKPAPKRAKFQMQTAKLFTNGRSQAVRLPKEFRLPGTEVCIKKIGNTIMLFPKGHVWETVQEGLDGFTDDFLAEGRDQGEQAEREPL